MMSEFINFIINNMSNTDRQLNLNKFNYLATKNFKDSNNNNIFDYNQNNYCFTKDLPTYSICGGSSNSNINGPELSVDNFK